MRHSLCLHLELSVRWIISITATLLALGLFAIYVASPPEPQLNRLPADRWVRTQDGWEQPRWWKPLQPEYPATLHPLVVALLELLLSVIALLAFPVPAATEKRRTTGPRGPPLSTEPS